MPRSLGSWAAREEGKRLGGSGPRADRVTGVMADVPCRPGQEPCSAGQPDLPAGELAVRQDRSADQPHRAVRVLTSAATNSVLVSGLSWLTLTKAASSPCR